MDTPIPAIVVKPQVKHFGEALEDVVNRINRFFGYDYMSLHKEPRCMYKWSVVGTSNLEIIEITADRAFRFFIMQRVLFDPMAVCMHSCQRTFPMKVTEGCINLLYSNNKSLEANIYSALSYLIVARIPIF